MRLLNLDCLQGRGDHLPADILHDLDKTSAMSVQLPRSRIMKERPDDVSDIRDFYKVFGVSRETMCRELIRYRQDNLLADCHLPDYGVTFGLLPVELHQQKKLVLHPQV